MLMIRGDGESRGSPAPVADRGPCPAVRRGVQAGDGAADEYVGAAGQSIIERLAVVTREIETLAANMLEVVASPVLLKMLAECEAEKTRLEGQLSTPTMVAPSDAILPHPALLQLFQEKVSGLREAIDAETVRSEAAEILSMLIESVTIYPDGKDGPEAEVVAKVADLITFATNDNAALGGGVGRSMVLVAGTGFEPVTFRL